MYLKYIWIVGSRFMSFFFQSTQVDWFHGLALSKSHRAGAFSDGFIEPTAGFNRFGGAGIGLGSFALK